MKKLMQIALGVGILATSASAQQYTEAYFNQLFIPAVSYLSVARVCGDQDSIQKSERVLRRVINFGEHRNILSAEGRFYLPNPELAIARGEEQYRRDRYVGCSQAKDAIQQLDKATMGLP